ncbi:MAG: hypothetical protein IT236_07005 [Bacteroidia bacterium]|nr:hypothetical protein [Bacteroidia bacterium]
MKNFLLIGTLVFVLFAFKNEKDPLHKRTFNISLDEIRDSVSVKKPFKDVIEFKNGKLRSKYLKNKFAYDWMLYRITKDSTFIDSTETEVRWLEVEAHATDEKNQTVLINFTTVEWDIDGEIKITKNDKLKKYFEMVGREKGGKPKKLRAPRKHIIEIQNENNAIQTQTIIAPPGSK